MNRKWKNIIATLAGIAMILGSGTASYAAVPDLDADDSSASQEVDADTLRAQVSAEQLLSNGGDLELPMPTQSPQARAAAVACNIVAESPHFSSGAGGVIYKSRVTCNTAGCGCDSVIVTVYGNMYFDYATSNTDTGSINWVKKKSSMESRKILANGATYTFYTPKLGDPGLKGTGFWQGTSILMINGIAVDNSTSGVTWRKAL